MNDIVGSSDDSYPDLKPLMSDPRFAIIDHRNPNSSADYLFRLYKPLASNVIDSKETDTFSYFRFSKYNFRENSKKASQIAVRLFFKEDFTQGLRILVFSNPEVCAHRLSMAIKPLTNQLIDEKNELKAAQFSSFSKANDLGVTFLQGKNNLILQAFGSVGILQEACSSFVEIVLGEPGTCLFRVPP